MSKLRISGFTISLDGYGAGAQQGLDHPLGIGGENLHAWLLPTRTFQSMHGDPGEAGKPTAGTTGIDDDFARRGVENVGAWILGRNMFGPIRGAWSPDGGPDKPWNGWWGDNPPYHVPVFVLTHHARRSVEMDGGTTFHFVTGGIEDALRRARSAAAGKDVRIGGGVETIRQYLKAGLVDEVHLALSPVLLGSGEHLLHGIDLPALGYQVTEHVPSVAASHVVLARTS
jgi:dihydrofolate reductase